jgi:hypothetical protein
MKSVILFLSLVFSITAKADFGTGMVVGMMLSSGGDETVIKIQDGGHPCLITLKKTGGTFQLNANYIQTVEDLDLRANCKSDGFLSQKCDRVIGSKITLANKERYNTFSSVAEIKDQIKSSCPIEVKPMEGSNK